MICFDADFPALARVDADIMIVPARDWPEMGTLHSRMADMRVVENGYSMVRQAEFGVSGAFDAQGRTLSEHVHERGDRHVVVSEVPVRGSATPLSGDRRRVRVAVRGRHRPADRPGDPPGRQAAG
ncbi:hypothetical protein [Nonomuraea sp. GTA35]|uniref:hypothetical protein n=1 Tax=Nonomuraea sp. GTA35 TaxID=1676746 RepID=UPI0035C17ABA